MADQLGTGDGDAEEVGRDREYRKPWWSKAILAVGTLGVALVAVFHLAMTFLVNSPSNTLSDRFSPQMNQWIYPWFDQNWRLFAPNPMSQNITIETRVASDCGGHVSPWYDLTAMDLKTIRHNPFPGHTEQNELRRAWLDGYVPNHTDADVSLGLRGDLTRQYLVNIALDRVRPLTAADGLPPAQITAIEFRVTTQEIALPATPKLPPAPDVRIVSWRQTTADAIPAGCANGGLPS